MELLSEECRVETVTEGDTSRLVCIIPKEKCPKEERLYLKDKIIIGKFSVKCLRF